MAEMRAPLVAHDSLEPLHIMSIAALVLGIVGLVLSLVPCLGMYALPLTVIAVILGLLGMKKPTNKGLAIAGLVCGLIGTVVGSYWLYAYMTIKPLSDAELAKDKAKLEELGSDLKKDMDKPAAKNPDQPDSPPATK
jgi:hypothetical protein